MNAIRRMLKNTASLTTAKVVSMAATIVFSIFAARYLGDMNYGTYAFIVVLTSYFMVTSEYGLENLIVRDVADKKERSNDYLTSTIAIKIFTALLSLVLLIVTLLILKRQDIITITIWAGLGIVPFVLYMSFDAAFRAHEEMQYITIIESFYAIIRSLSGIWIVTQTADLTDLFKAFLIVEILRLILAFFFYSRKLSRIHFTVNVNLVKHLLKSGFSMAYWKLLGILYAKVDMLILSIMLGDVAVGWFKVARNITDIISIGSMIVMNVLMPVLTVIFSRSKENFRDAYVTVFKYIIIVMLPLAVLIASYSDTIILSLYGEQYENSVRILQLLIFAAIANFILSLIGTTIIIIDKFKIAAKISIFTVIIRVIACVYLINYYGYLGACYAAILVGVINIMMHIPIIYLSIGKIGLERYGLKLTSVLAILTFIFLLIKDVIVIDYSFIVPLTILLYLLLLTKLNIINQRDILMFRQEA